MTRDALIDEMVTWLRAQFDADERAARNASPGPWRHNPAREFRMPGSEALEFVGSGADDEPGFHGIAATGPADDPQSMADAWHIARHHPAHVLSDTAAKRKIIDLYDERGRPADLEPVARAIAAGYQDRAGYRTDWAPGQDL